MAEHDYDEIADKTIDEIKEMVKDEDIDLTKLLKAEKKNKDRKTLKEWLEPRIDDEDEEPSDSSSTTTKTEANQQAQSRSDSMTSVSMWKRPKTVFLIGLVIGLLLGASALYTSGGAGGQAAITEQQAAAQADTYFTEQLGGIVPANISVAEVDGQTYSDLYVLTMNVQTTNRTAQRDVYMSKQSGLLFINSLFGGIPPINSETGEPVGSSGPAPGGQ